MEPQLTRHEAPGGRALRRVDGLGEELLAGARLAGEHHREARCAPRCAGELDGLPQRLRLVEDGGEGSRAPAGRPGWAALRRGAQGRPRPERAGGARHHRPHHRADRAAVVPHRLGHHLEVAPAQREVLGDPRRAPPPPRRAAGRAGGAPTRGRCGRSPGRWPPGCAPRRRWPPGRRRWRAPPGRRSGSPRRGPPGPPRSRSSTVRAIASASWSAWGERASQGPVMSTSPTGASLPGRKTGAPAQDQHCQASTKCSEAKTSIGFPSRMAVPGPLVPADSSAQLAPGRS